MPKSYNHVTLVGNTGRDPDVRETARGTTVANVSIATNDGWGDNERTNWHRIVVFGKLADIVAEYVSKGDRILVSGHIQYDSYEKDGITFNTSEIVAEDIVLLGGNDAVAAPAAAPATTGGTKLSDVTLPDDDLPF